MSWRNLPASVQKMLVKEEYCYRLYIQTFQELAREGEQALQQYGVHDFHRLRDENFEGFFNFLVNFSNFFSLFPNPTLHKKLNELGITGQVTRWFISFEEIDRQFDEIAKKNIIVLKGHALFIIVHYLRSKIRSELVHHAPILPAGSGDRKKELSKIMSNLFRRRKYAEGKGKTTSGIFDLVMNTLIAQLEKALGNSKTAKRFYVNMLSGKTETIFVKELIACLIPATKMSAPDFANAISGLLKLLLKDRYRLFADADELLFSDAFYGENYSRYLASRITKITQSREPGFDDFRKNLEHE